MSFLNLKWSGENQITPKALPLCLLDVLLTNSDKDHPLRQQEIIDALKSEYGLSIERKAIGANLKLLEDLGFEIQKTKEGVYLNNPVFDVSEIRYLIDAVFSSKNIKSAQCKDLSERLAGFCSKYQRKNYSYLVNSNSLTRRNTKVDFFYNVEVINEAIAQEKMISFKYRCYGYDGSEKVRGKYGDGQVFRVSPYYLISNNSRYYLLGYYKYGNLSAYRVDHMVSLKILDEPRKPVREVVPDFNLASYLNERIYLFGGEPVTAKLLLHNEGAVDSLRDWFGDAVSFFEEEGKHYARVRSVQKALSYWALQYGEEVTVVEPASLVDDVKKMISNISNNYGLG